jgi:hypothetical protein
MAQGSGCVRGVQLVMSLCVDDASRLSHRASAGPATGTSGYCVSGVMAGKEATVNQTKWAKIQQATYWSVLGVIAFAGAVALVAEWLLKLAGLF